MVTMWERGEEVIAHKFRKEDLPGLLRKTVDVGENEEIIVEKKGEIYEDALSGKKTVSHLLDMDFNDVVFADISEKKATFDLGRLLSSDEGSFSIKAELGIKVVSPEKLARELMYYRRELDMEDLWSQVQMDILSEIVIPHVERRKIAEISADLTFRETLKGRVHDFIRARLLPWGIETVSLNLLWELPAVPEEREETQENEEPEVIRPEPKQIPKPPELKLRQPQKEIPTREEKLAELENKRLEREVEMQLEKEQTQRDMEDALEATELKAVKDRKKLLVRKEEKDLVVEERPEEPAAEQKEDVEGEIEKIENAKALTERKFFLREISEPSFRKMMDDYERKLVELLAKSEKK